MRTLTRDQFIDMAREADPFGEAGRLFTMASQTPAVLERFVDLVSASADAARMQAQQELAECREAMTRAEHEARRLRCAADVALDAIKSVRAAQRAGEWVPELDKKMISALVALQGLE